MGRHAAILILVVGGLLLTPGAAGTAPDVPGDPTPPVVTPIISGTLGSNGWYVTTVTVNWSIVDPESIILSTDGCDARTLSADTTATTLTCRAESDGGITTVGKTFKIDKTAPGASSDPARAADANGWYNHALTVSYSGSDATSGVDSCSAPKTYSGPDSASATLSGTCTDKAGNTGQAPYLNQLIGQGQRFRSRVKRGNLYEIPVAYKVHDVVIELNVRLDDFARPRI